MLLNRFLNTTKEFIALYVILKYKALPQYLKSLHRNHVTFWMCSLLFFIETWHNQLFAKLFEQVFVKLFNVHFYILMKYK